MKSTTYPLHLNCDIKPAEFGREDVENLAQSCHGNSCERYLKLYNLVMERDKHMADAFDDFRRSTAIMQLGIMRRMKLLTDDELGLFSEQTRTRVEVIASI